MSCVCVSVNTESVQLIQDFIMDLWTWDNDLANKDSALFKQKVQEFCQEVNTPSPSVSYPCFW